MNESRIEWCPIETPNRTNGSEPRPVGENCYAIMIAKKLIATAEKRGVESVCNSVVDSNDE